MFQKQVELHYIWFSGNMVIWIQRIENCVYPVQFLERQELHPINNMQE